MFTNKGIIDKASRIILESATPEHAQLLYDIFMGINTQKYSPVSKVSVPELAERLNGAGRNFSEQASVYRYFGKIESNPFGTFVVKNIDWEARNAEIGFSLLDAWQGQGFGSALVYKCVGKIFAESVIDTVWATVSVTNEACRKLMHSLGFNDCGLYKETFVINGEPVQQILYQMSRLQARDLFP